ncbi:L-azetidine-2-carboxylic acid acetyltransferase [Zancudomyces culisetae]|uniref:L-azetidine-2-carboxylic acid acetyltransferase n=1 Tax=Zancudomyces culisetae TaxID=1213189 RepID=A0A1R1PZJ1_ZANCU|nr:L-azetidine-2-carboxylic acid acetyltransferase [Zancudomyces culisetae]|eukprot:OMH86366.1 L-azetidine-2-carboxylic acid acetyltransferase [Zancudomyces culisetae]
MATYGNVKMHKRFPTAEFLSHLPISGTLKDESTKYYIFRVAETNDDSNVEEGYTKEELEIKNTEEYQKFVEKSTITLKGRPNLLNHLTSLLDKVIEDGDTYPHEHEMGVDGFKSYFLSGEAFVLFNEHTDFWVDTIENWNENVMGLFYVKPNYPGRCSHVCNGGFITAPRYRSMGVGLEMGKAYLVVAPLIGYVCSLFNLVFVTNGPSLTLWKKLGFHQIGTLPKAGRLKGYPPNEYVDAAIFYYDFQKSQ